MATLPFKTLISKEEYRTSERWYPEPVDRYKCAINVWGNEDDTKRLRNNFAYNMQYIEYIEKQLAELKLSNVILTMLYKSYIITGMSIIEGLFVNLLHRTGKWGTSTWEEFSCVVANPKDINGDVVKVETHLFKQVPEYEMRMDLDSMIKKIEKKDLISIDHDTFPALKKLRELRNRVHLQIGDGPYDHDYNCIGFNEIQLMRSILYTILTSREFCNNSSVYDFIKNAYIERGGTL